jgi:hypothetical protein
LIRANQSLNGNQVSGKQWQEFVANEIVQQDRPHQWVT